MANVTIEIDADAAKYLAKAARMAQGTKKVTTEAGKTGKEFGKWTKEIGSAIPLVGQIATTAGVIGAAMSSVLSIARSVTSEFRKAAETSKQLGTTLAEVVGSSVGIQEFAKVKKGLSGLAGKGRLDDKGLTSAFSAAAGSAPRASTEALLEITGGAQQASLAFIDPTLVAKVAGALVNAGVDPQVANQLAAQIIQRSGGKASEAAQITAELIGQVGGDNAEDVARAVIAAAQSGTGFEGLRAATARFTGGGGFGAFLERPGTTTQLGVEQQERFKAIQRLLPATQVQTSGFLGDQARTAAGVDPTLAAQVDAERLRGKTAFRKAGEVGRFVAEVDLLRAQSADDARLLDAPGKDLITAIDRLAGIMLGVESNTRKSAPIGVDGEGGP